MLRYILTSIICITAFIIIGIAVSPKPGFQIQSIIKFDGAVSSVISAYHFDLLDEFMVLLSEYGREIVWVGVIILFSIFKGWKGKKIALVIVISFLIIMPLNTLLKNYFERPRPPIERPEIHVTQKVDFAYPSGHASIVSGGALILMMMFRKEKETIFSVVMMAEAILVCISRIYVGDHYLFDVIGGIMLGAGVSLCSISFSRYLDPIIVRVQRYLK